MGGVLFNAHFSDTHNKKGLPSRITLSLNRSLTVCYSRIGKPYTTIAANVFHF